MIVIFTAHWCKFENAMKIALGNTNLEYPEKIKQLLAMDEKPYAAIFKPDTDWTVQLKELIRN